MSSSPSASNSNKTFVVTPSANLSTSSTFKIKITTGVKDTSGNSLASAYTNTNGFITEESPKFVAVQPDGKISTSTDGISWTSRTEVDPKSRTVFLMS